MVDLDNVISIMCYLYACVADDKCHLTMRRDPNFVLSPDMRTCPVAMACDADLGNCKDTSRSRAGYFVVLFGNIIA